MSEHDEFVVESDMPERKTQGELTGWEQVVFELGDEDPAGD